MLKNTVKNNLIKLSLIQLGFIAKDSVLRCVS